MKVKSILSVFLVLVVLLFMGVPVYSGNQAEQIVTFSINTILEISVSGNLTSALTIDSVDPQYPAGEYDLLPDEDSSTTYSVTATVPFQITGQLQNNMVQGAWIFVKLDEPPEGYSLGFVQLNDNYGEKLPAQTLLTSDPTSAQGLTITYKFAADVFAGTASGNNVLILTMVEI